MLARQSPVKEGLDGTVLGQVSAATKWERCPTLVVAMIKSGTPSVSAWAARITSASRLALLPSLRQELRSATHGVGGDGAVFEGEGVKFREADGFAGTHEFAPDYEDEVKVATPLD